MYRSDPLLIQACLRGDQAAWNELISRYSRLVYSIPFRYGFSQADADDVFQNVFTIVFRRLNSLRNQASLSSWLIIITRHECQRLKSRSPLHDDLDENIEDHAIALPDHVHLWEKQYWVHLALEQLDTRCRELLTALFMENPTPEYEDIAMRFSIPVGSVGPTRSRCFKKFRAILMEMGVDLRE